MYAVVCIVCFLLSIYIKKFVPQRGHKVSHKGSVGPGGVGFPVLELYFLSLPDVLGGNELELGQLEVAGPARPHVHLRGGVVDAVPGRHRIRDKGSVVHQLLASFLASIQLEVCFLFVSCFRVLCFMLWFKTTCM